MNVHDKHIVSIKLSDGEIESLVILSNKLGNTPANDVLKRIIYQANDSPIFCSAYNRPIKHLNPSSLSCQPFPETCQGCSMALYEE